jgi:hypothetical protein
LRSRSIAAAGAVLLAAIAVLVFVPPIPQDPAYHLFADSREVFGIPNFWNVASNLPFLVVGWWGMVFVWRHGSAACAAGLELAYFVFFAGIFLTGFGSGYYHLDPGNDPLVWDRLPMTIGFSGLFSIVTGEFLSPRLGRAILIPLVIAGALSVEYWAFTEARGAGDLRAYAMFQFLPLLLVPFILAFRTPVVGAASYYWIMLLCYVFAKIAELLDAGIFSAGEIISGHSLKHLLAALAAAVLLYGLAQRLQSPAAIHDD